MSNIEVTHTDKKSYNNKHSCKIDGYDCLKILLLVKVGAVADDAKDNGWYNDVEDNP